MTINTIAFYIVFFFFSKSFNYYSFNSYKPLKKKNFYRKVYHTLFIYNLLSHIILIEF